MTHSASFFPLLHLCIQSRVNYGCDALGHISLHLQLTRSNFVNHMNEQHIIMYKFCVKNLGFLVELRHFPFLILLKQRKHSKLLIFGSKIGSGYYYFLNFMLLYCTISFFLSQFHYYYTRLSQQQFNLSNILKNLEKIKLQNNKFCALIKL